MAYHSILTLQLDIILSPWSKMITMPYTKKKPYRHKGGTSTTKKKYGSDALMVKSKSDTKASSTSYKDHIDGA